MPFTRPTLEALRTRIKADLAARLPGTDPMLRWNNLGILGDVEAGAAHLLYGRLEWSFEQLFPDTAEGPFLERWAGIWGVNRLPATRALGPAVFPATPGTSIPTGAIISRRDAVKFTVIEGGSYEPTDQSILVRVQAEEAGSAGNTDPGVQMTMATTVPGVQPLGLVVDPGLVGGAPEESDDLLLQRLLLRIQSPPHGGSASDYVQWALEVPGVTRAWCYPMEGGIGSVTVRFMMDQVRASTQGIPLPGDVDLVREHIEELKPVTALLYVLAPIAQPVDVAIEALVTDTPEVRTNINSALLQFFVDTAVPGGEIFPNEIIAAINTAPGVQRFRLMAPLASIPMPVGHIGILGTLSFA